MQTKLIYTVWDIATRVFGLRELGSCLQNWYPTSRLYKDSLFYYGGDDNEDASPVSYIALTIDDGLCRQNDNSVSMLEDVCDLLERYDHSKATFFVCTDYTEPKDATILLQNGHELANHLKKDISNFYCNLSKEDFQKELVEANKYLESILLEYNNNDNDTNNRVDTQVKWFRAPQGRMSIAMKEVIREMNMVNVMGDCYCDDWVITEAIDGRPVEDQREKVGPIVDLMLRQVQQGSIVIFHMPERNFRQSTMWALEMFLENCQRRNLKCVTLSRLHEVYYIQRNSKFLHRQEGDELV
jgi:peptidoglycan/xylan/chitin deacetylase (PgdA/CDA1 family)